MKKLLILCCILALAFGATGATCKSYWAGAQDKICNPPAAVVDVIKLGIPIIKIAISLALPGSQAVTDAIEAEAAANLVLNTGCVGVTSLNKLIAFLQSDTAKQVQATLATEKMKAVGATVKPLNIAPLQAWASTAGK